MGRRLSHSMEDYLRTIHVLEMEGAVRVKDIARRLSITMPSVSSALKNLERLGFVAHPRYDLVDLTPEGKRVASEISYRHGVIKNFLSEVLGIDENIAERDACGMEHSISPETLESLIDFMETTRNKQPS